jgi:hypothetical protein
MARTRRLGVALAAPALAATPAPAAAIDAAQPAKAEKQGIAELVDKKD